MQNAPICLFVYNRLWHTQQTVSSLLQNDLAKESDLFIFADGPKNQEQAPAVKAVRDWLETVEGFKSIQMIKQETNLGLAQSIISGVTKIINTYGKAIIIEDDLLLSPYFLSYMNQGLALYENDSKVASIHGYTFPFKTALPDTFFLKGADCWGWATWKRAWDKFESDGQKLLVKLKEKKLGYEFDFDNTQPNIQMLKDQIAGKNNSWAIRWNASAFIHDMVTLYPGMSLVRNIGFDNSGMHCVATNMYDVTISQAPVKLERLAIVKNEQAYQVYVKYFKSLAEPLHKKLIRKTKALFVS
ncbi:MAG: glycosyltransferase family 2 protein [Proteobacteria bacterium]|nr:glycosyltransferase family 2 protein [Pseudomonadota bacterium]